VRFIRSKKKLLNRGKGNVAYMAQKLHSRSEKFLLDVLEAMYNIKIERQYPLGRRFYDGRWGDHLIEIDGSHWHDMPEMVKKDAAKDKLAAKFGFKIHRIRLDKKRDVPVILEQHKSLFDEIFLNVNDSQPKISSSSRSK
jgi:very-short-patch-repair endonuclease